MDVIGFLEKLNWQTIIGMFVIGWFFTREIKATLIKLEADVKAQGARTDRLYEMFIDLLKEKK